MTDNIRTNKSLGQHWLRDESALSAMCEAAEVAGSDNVLEIGPGLGTLTELLVSKADTVTAVEFDDNLARQLPDRVKADNLEVVNQDILHFDLGEMPKNYKLVANIPYYLTSNLIRRISESNNPPSIAVILIQKEVAERVVAGPGEMSLLSVTAQFYWKASLGRIVEAELFDPVPKVDSQILILSKRLNPLFEVDTRKFFRVVKAGFSQRRKTILNSLSAGLQLSKDEVKSICDKAGIDSARRSQSLSLDEWHELYEATNT